MVIKMLPELRGRIDEHTDNFNKEKDNRVLNRTHRVEEYND